MSKFPIILYPKPVEEFLKSVETENNKIPCLPSSPVLKNAASLASVNEVSFPSLLKLCLLGNFILLIGAILFNNLPIWLLVLLFLSCNYILLFSWKKVSIGQFYRKSLFEEDSSQLKQYDKQLKAYKKLSAERIKRQQQYDKTITVYRKELQTKLKQSLLPTSYSTAQQGASEGRFRRYLDKYFPSQVHQGFEIIIPNSNFSYSTDFTYIDKSLNLYVDIEIDEPYYYKTKEPTHCSDQEKDKHRNAFFLENNWVVIRFAEEQKVVCI